MPTPYFAAIMQRRARRRALRQSWRASANDESMPPHWDEFVNGNDGGESPDYGALAGGALGLASTFASTANEDLPLSQIPGTQRSATGQPVYNLGASYNEAYQSKPQGATGGEILSAAGQGAAAGTAVLPGIGTAVGAGIGALGSIISGGIRKSRERRQRRTALEQLATGQHDFNQASQAFDNQQLSLDDYYRRADLSTQLHNLYR